MEMVIKGIEKFYKLIADFRLLETKVQNDNQVKLKNLERPDQVLDVCKKEYLKLFVENEMLKKRLSYSKN